MKYLKTLLKLKQNKSLNYSQIPPKLLQKLKEEGLIKITGTSRKKVVVNEYFDKVYKDIEKIDNANSRSELSNIGDTKLKQIYPMSGFYINGVCKLENITLPIIDESVLFLKNLPKIDTNILIVILENFENLVYCEKLLKYFKKENILFIYRNSAVLKILKDLENEIIYFSDFDLAGVSIYLNEIFVRNNTIKLFIPDNIESLLNNFGSNNLYKKHYIKYKNLKSNNKEVQKLIETIHKTQKSIEQEWFIND